MIRKAIRQAILLLFTVLVGPGVIGAQETLQVINGWVKEIRAGEQQLILSYRHPVSGKTEELVLQVDRRTGFPKGIRLEDLRRNDLLSVDYRIFSGAARAFPEAVRVERISVKGVSIDGVTH